jgi:hypothetical protein
LRREFSGMAGVRPARFAKSVVDRAQQEFLRNAWQFSHSVSVLLTLLE